MRVMIVEAAREPLQRLKNICQRLGYDLINYNTAAAAEQALTDASLEVNVVLLAHHLPDGTGLALCQGLRQHQQYQHLPCLLITSDTHQELIAKAMSSGVTEVFVSAYLSPLEAFLRRFIKQSEPLIGRIMLVEDSLALQKMLGAQLRGAGLEVDTFSDVDSAWQAFALADYDLVVSDIVLEGEVSGTQLVNRIRSIESAKGDTSILVMSGYDDASRRLELFRLGINDYIRKPLNVDEFMVRVRGLVERQQLQITVHKQNHELSKINASLKQFLSRTSHECRNAVNIILGASRMLGKAKGLAQRQQDQASMIHSAAQQQLQLLNDILDYSKFEAGKLELAESAVVLKNAVAEAVKLYVYRAEEKALTLSINIADDTPADAWLDKQKLLQVLMNLLGNAIKFTETGGVDISVCQEKEADSEWLQFSVKDSGGGIAEEDIKKLFKAFSQTDSARLAGEGTGLGLSICASFAAMMGGDMQVVSKLGKGSVFTLRLPYQPVSKMN